MLRELESVGVSQVLVVSSIGVSQQIREGLEAYVPQNEVALSYLEHEGPLNVAGAITAATSAVGSEWATEPRLRSVEAARRARHAFR